MSSVSRAISRVLERDTVTREALTRGIVNLRALARWLIETEGLDATEDAVVSSLRRSRHTGHAPLRRYGSAYDLLARAHVNSRSHVGMLTLHKTQRVQRILPSLVNAMDVTRGDLLRIVQTTRAIKIIVDHHNLAAIQRHVPEGLVSAVVRDLTELNIVLPDECVQTPGILALICDTIAAEGVSIVDVVSGIPEHFLLVRDVDTMRAYEALVHLSRGAAERPVAAECRNPHPRLPAARV